MQTNKNTSIERIIAKIDNDFNPDNSDWIPRVAAWSIDAMNIIGVPNKVIAEKIFKVKDRIAYLDIHLNNNKCDLFTNEDIPIVKITCSKLQPKFGYTILDDNKIELNFDTDYIIAKYETAETYCSSMFNCDLPVIPDNGLLVEAITNWCIYKMLCRGYKHPVLNLNGNNPATNPYVAWTQLKDKAHASVINQAQGDFDSSIWRSSFFINSFDPRNQKQTSNTDNVGITRNPTIDYTYMTIVKDYDPNRAPSKIGQRWINTANKHTWDAVGIDSVDDWIQNN